MTGNGKSVLQSSAATSSTTVAVASHDLNGAHIKSYLPTKPSVDQPGDGGFMRQGEREKSNERSFSHDAHFVGQDRVYSIDDEEIDEPPVPIPSTWRQTKKDGEKSWIAAQVKSSAYGFMIGLFIVVSAVMLLTMVKDNRWMSGLEITEYAYKTSDELGLSSILSTFDFGKTQETAQQSYSQAPHGPSATTRQRPGETDDNVDGGNSFATLPEAQSSETELNTASNKVLKDAEALKTATAEPSFEQARQAIDDGRMSEAQVILAKLASLGDSEAIFVLAETFDPNVLAARGMHGQEANVEKAKIFYSMALSQGVEKAKLRLEALK